MKKTLWTVIFTLAILAAYISWSHPDWLAVPPFQQVQAQGVCVGNPDGKCEFNPYGASDKNAPPDQLEPLDLSDGPKKRKLITCPECGFEGEEVDYKHKYEDKVYDAEPEIG